MKEILKKGDYVLITTKNNLAFSGEVSDLKDLLEKNEKIFVLKPSERSPIWMVVERDFIKFLKKLVPKEEGK